MLDWRLALFIVIALASTYLLIAALRRANAGNWKQIIESALLVIAGVFGMFPHLLHLMGIEVNRPEEVALPLIGVIAIAIGLERVLHFAHIEHAIARRLPIEAFYGYDNVYDRAAILFRRGE